jgi:hypothetical protein
LALGHEFRPGGTMNGTVHATAAEQRRIRRVNNGINFEPGDVSVVSS